MHPFHGDEGEKGGIDSMFMQRVIGETILIGDGLSQTFFRNPSFFQQDVRKRTMVGLCLANRFPKRTRVKQIARQKNFFQ